MRLKTVEKFASLLKTRVKILEFQKMPFRHKLLFDMRSEVIGEA